MHGLCENVIFSDGSEMY